MSGAPLTAVKVGMLMCQRFPFLKEMSTRVVSCELAPPPPALKKTEKKATATAAASEGASSPSPSNVYHVVLEDSVLFPEGGGQPCDHGTIDDTIAVTNVQRRGDTCVLYTHQPLSAGASVRVKVDWPRRHDHMQHHTGQHLLTAVVERELGLPTESWALSWPTCYLQLPTASIPPADVARVEALCNDYIRQGVPVHCDTYVSKDDLPPSRSRSIPADVTGPIRIITLSSAAGSSSASGEAATTTTSATLDVTETDIDACTCCGTHLEDLRQLQAVKLLHQESKGNTCKLHFIVGDRVLSQCGEMYHRERALVKEIGTNAEDLLNMVQRRAKELSDTAKVAKKALAELSTVLAPSLAVQAAEVAAQQVPFVYARDDCDLDFFVPIVAAIKAGAASDATPTPCCLFYTTSQGEQAAFLITGPEDGVKKLSALVCAATGGKGGGRADQGFRGKCDAKKLKQFCSKELAAAWK